MNSKKTRFDAINRWRHRHGFGVHSPFAFEIIKRVVAPGSDAAYYGYDDILASFSPGPFGSRQYRMSKTATMLLRLTERLQPQEVCIPSNIHHCFETAVRAADSRIKIVNKLTSETKLALFPFEKNGNSAISDKRLQTIRDFISRPDCCALLLDVAPEVCGRICDDLKCGLLLSGRHYSIVFHRQQMPAMVYSI